MAQRESPIDQLERLLRAGDAPGAAAAATALLAKVPNSFPARLARARAYLMADRPIEAERDLVPALALSPRDELANLLRAQVDLQYGKLDEAIPRLRWLAEGRGRLATDATIGLLDALASMGEREEARRLVERGGAWTSDPRAPLHLARATASLDPAQGVEAMLALLRGGHHPELRRRAGFEAAGLLDRMQRFREAFDTAREAHAVAPERPDAIAEVIRTAEELLARLETGVRWFEPRAPRVEGVAMMVALPRSGTTLLEQMLDRHPEISGIGEFKGLIAIINGLGQTGYWPQRPNLIPAARLAELQSLYLEGAGHIRRPGARWIFDKVLRAWRAIPEIAAVLPGAAVISVDRDPRDTATSIFLSFFNPGVIPWSGDFGSMRRMIELKRRIAPLSLELFRMPNVHVAYEDLVEDPGHHAARCLRLMGLAMDERVTRPEESARRAVTLSSEQVRRPINRSSIGRWRNYAWAFDASWDAVVAEHDAMIAASRTDRLAATTPPQG